MEYRLDIFSRNPQMLLDRMAKNCKARRLEKGYSRKTLSGLTGIPEPTIERFERTGKISLESFCRIIIEFDYFDEMGLYAFSSGINLILIITILISNFLVNKITGASLDSGIGG